MPHGGRGGRNRSIGSDSRFGLEQRGTCYCCSRYGTEQNQKVSGASGVLRGVVALDIQMEFGYKHSELGREVSAEDKLFQVLACRWHLKAMALGNYTRRSRPGSPQH